MIMEIKDNCTGCTVCVRACPVGAISGQKKAIHVINPGKCVGCGACGRVCPQGAVVDGNGKVVARLMPRAAWPKPVFDLDRCISCGACEEKCPAGCIRLSEGKPGGLEAWPSLSAPETCVSCGYCAFYCPMECIELREPAREAINK
ncbi:MAG: hypothetical protein A2Z99_18030 [Treponema sp. GWB1_62_6]|nr:MAG: hypothetical protein A2001_17115 [Treponema sp. GWC1_61_84]OHE66137.1 MAG: hypothetical protein A2Z99_18030 [Treponema sp. GWB1_62_6]OHE66252.1 MAG: hypothetical protein A2Y36_03205 [Treponema sp. GWA1_62_8]OHE71799.1 MAG: hypothetical protein A2413_08510 [Treponema sp. RIFOXYC1_FULL_61_9]HCM28534.1 hydrogenase [Treponema sp.]